MPAELLHRRKDFPDLIRIVARDMGIDPALVEKDYWIMQSLYGLQVLGLHFELKGGTSLSKGYRFIDRFSEDIDLRIAPDPALQVATGKNHNKPAQVESRRAFYDHLAQTIRIDGVRSVERDAAFDDPVYYRGGGIRLLYDTATGEVPGLKTGILLEAGFDDVAPNRPIDIGSWAYDFAATRVEILDNRAKAVACYHPGYTLVEKLQAISTKYRQQQQEGVPPPNFMRHYYDVYCLLRQPDVQAFIGSADYLAHKAKRFRQADDPDIVQNPAFSLADPADRKALARAYGASGTLYYRGQPAFDDILAEIAAWAPRL